MARTEHHRIHNREAVADMADWLKEKHCPHKKKYMSGKRIQPKNLNGREKLTYIVDEPAEHARATFERRRVLGLGVQGHTQRCGQRGA